MPSPRPVKQLFAGGGLDADRIEFDRQQAGDALAHGHRMRANLGALADHGDVGIADAPAALAQQAVAMLQKLRAIGVFPVCIGRREMPADIAQRQRAQHRIAQGVQHHIAIAMGEHAMAVRHAHAAKHHVVAGAECMHVVALADSEIEGHEEPVMIEVENNYVASSRQLGAGSALGAATHALYMPYRAPASRLPGCERSRLIRSQRRRCRCRR